MRQIGALALVLALSACGGDPEPRFDDDPTPTVAPSSAEPSKEPWEEKSDDGAIAFVEHWIDEFSVAFQTGETGSVDSLSTDGCDACAGLMGLVQDAYGNGGRIRGEAWRVVGARPSGTPPTNKAAVAADIAQPAQVIMKAGERPTRTEPGEVTYLFELTWNDEWLVSSILIQE